nr:MAG TPA: RimK-related lysine biosynthesis protein, Probable-dependent amine/thiol ligase family Amino-group [Caudoviricetes sp.]
MVCNRSKKYDTIRERRFRLCPACAHGNRHLTPLHALLQFSCPRDGLRVYDKSRHPLELLF